MFVTIQANSAIQTYHDKKRPHFVDFLPQYG